MRKMKASGVAAAVIAAVTLTASMAAGASAAQSGEGTALTVQAGGQCTGSWVTVHDHVVAQARPQAGSGAIFDIYKDETFPCRKIVVGASYGACGYTGANGWILVQDGILRHNNYAGWSGYIPSVCTTDR